MPAGRRGSRPSFACATSYLSRAPPSPDSALPSQSGDARDFSLAPHPSLPVAAEKTTIDPERAYRLPDLIDIGESTNPDTRIEWEKARQAVLAVGLARSEYLPTISAMALGGYHRTWFQVPAGSNPWCSGIDGFRSLLFGDPTTGETPAQAVLPNERLQRCIADRPGARRACRMG